MTLSPENIDRVDDTLAAVKRHIPDFGWRDLHINLLHHSDHYFANTMVRGNAPETLTAVVQKFIERRGVPQRPTHLLEHLYLRHVGQHLRTGRSSLPCASLAGNAFVDPTGLVFPCHIWARPIASLRDYDWSLASIWQLEAARKARLEVEAERCPGCWTPCEAYPTLLSNLPRAAQGLATFRT